MNNKFYTPEVEPFQKDNMTLAVTPDLRFSDEYNYNKVFNRTESKIKLDLNNFTNGKGKDAVHLYFNLTLAQFREVYRAFNNGTMGKFFYTTSYDMYPVKEGTYAGKHEVRILNLEYVSSMRNPYKVEITNGYANEGEQKATIDVKTDKVFLKGDSFGKLLDEINDAIDVAKIDYAMSGILSKGRAGFEKQKEEYKKNAKNKSAETQNAASPQPVQTTSQTNTSTNSAEPEKEIHAVNGKFTSEFMKLSNCYVVDFTVNSRVFKIYFREVPDDLRTVQELGQDVTINIYQFGDKFIFDSLL